MSAMAAPLSTVDEKKIAVDNVLGAQMTPIQTATAGEPSGTLAAIKGWLLPRHDQTAWAKFLRFFTFLGPGAIISVAYIDPDNYQVAISAGGSFQYKLLFMVLVSNIIAIYLQSLSVKLGTVTGMDLAQMNHRYLPRWLELSIYAIAEACIICTDLGQVIGTAIALNMLIPQIPLPAGCVISVAETLLILIFYNNRGELRRIRIFEMFIAILVLTIFIVICVALGMIEAPAGQVFRGYVPSREIFVGTGLYESCAILGGTLMPHAFYLGTALTRARLYDFDVKNNLSPASSPASSTESLYRPSLRAIKACLHYSIAELAFTLFTVAVFVNSALLIISGSAFYDPYAGDDTDDGGAPKISGDLYDIYNLFRESIAPAAGILFAVSLLFSGISAGLVATMAGQIVMEGALNIRLSPFLRRLITRCVAIIPALIIAASLGQEGLSQALVAGNYILAVGLIFITFPVVWYTCCSKYMQVPTDDGTGAVDMKNNVPTAIAAWVIWLLVVVMDVATIVLIGLGLADDD
ncbi:natural resistance-associated macrophage protein-domain-containing protein [Coniochaeta sp. 2T2.1]|nr:natural resistance-associated macrophage protein-domain-containing protein [Coniochaeta sp. 2T2.1]